MFLIGLKRKFNNSNSIYKIYVLIGKLYEIRYLGNFLEENVM